LPGNGNKEKFMGDYRNMPPHISHAGGKLIGAIGALTLVIVAASATATVFPEVFRLSDVRVETQKGTESPIEALETFSEAPREETEKNIDSLINEAVSAAVSDAAESAGLDETDIAALASTAESEAETAHEETPQRPTAAETEPAAGPAAETTGAATTAAPTEAEGPGRETVGTRPAKDASEAPAGPGAEAETEG
jgi:hypothetical protein